MCEGRVGRDRKGRVKPGGGVHEAECMSEEIDDSQQQCVEGLVSTPTKVTKGVGGVP